MQDIFADFMIWFSTTFQLFQTPPYSAIFIMLISMTITMITNLTSRRFTDLRRLNRYQAEVKQYQEMQKQAEKTQNEKLMRKVKRRKAYIDRIQREMMTQRCKPSLIFIVPFLIVFQILRGFYFNSATGLDRVVAIIPFNVHKLLPFLQGWLGVPTAYGFGMTFFGFYMMVGLGIGQILQRLMGINITGTWASTLFKEPQQNDREEYFFVENSPFRLNISQLDQILNSYEPLRHSKSPRFIHWIHHRTSSGVVVRTHFRWSFRSSNCSPCCVIMIEIGVKYNKVSGRHLIPSGIILTIVIEYFALFPPDFAIG